MEVSGLFRWKVDKSEVVNWLSNLIGGLEAKASETVAAILNIYELIVRVLVPVWTGELRDSHVVELGGLKGSLYFTVVQGYFIILGTPQHDIGSPVFIEKYVGDWRYIGRSPSGKGKPHPGTRAYDYFQDAVDQGDIEGPLNDLTSWMENA